MIEFMEKRLANPLIASSCIATETAGNILKLAENGVQGAILKSCADYTREAFTGKREFAREQKTGFLYHSHSEKCRNSVCFFAGFCPFAVCPKGCRRKFPS